MSLPTEESLQKMNKEELINSLKKGVEYWKNYSSREYYEKLDIMEEIQTEKVKNKKFHEVEDWHLYQQMIKNDFETKMDILKQESKDMKKNKV